MNSCIRILIVDDDLLVSDSIAAFLEDEGFQVACVARAEDALERLSSDEYQVCITDFTLPGMDGESLILSAHDKGLHTSFIMHTGIPFVPTSELLQTGFTAGQVMAKPIMCLDLLSEKIRQLAFTVDSP